METAAVKERGVEYRALGRPAGEPLGRRSGTLNSGPMSDPLPPLVGPEQAALIERRVSVIVATRDAAHRPHLMRAVGRTLSADRRRVTVFLSASSSAAVLADLRANGLIAVVFSEPSTDRTLQLKGIDAVIAAVEPGDEARVQAYLHDFIAEIGQLGFAENVARTLLGVAPGDLLAVHFTPQAAFNQTPGPKAGEALHPVAA